MQSDKYHLIVALGTFPAFIDQCQGPCIVEHNPSIVTVIAILLRIIILCVCMMWERKEHVAAYVQLLLSF